MATRNWATTQARIHNGIFMAVLATGSAYGACPLDIGHLRVGENATYCTTAASRQRSIQSQPAAP
jgi:hypothetical protein